MESETLSMEAVLVARLRPVFELLLRAELADIRADLAALKTAAPPALGTVEEAAERLHMSPATIRRWLDDGRIEGRKIGRSWRVDLGALRSPTAETIAALAAEARR